MTMSGWISFEQVKEGQTIVADGGFTCMEAGPKLVEAGDHGLFVRCQCGQHYLDGQIDDGDEVVGFHPESDEGRS
jgi:hypothetical protein